MSDTPAFPTGSVPPEPVAASSPVTGAGAAPEPPPTSDPAGNTATEGDGFDRQLLYEIRILIDYLSSINSRGLASGTAGRLPTTSIGSQALPTTYSYSQALQDFFIIAGKQKPGASVLLTPTERRFLSEFRDYLAEAAKPASATTIAFSTLVSQYERSGKKAPDDPLFASINRVFPSFAGLASSFRTRIAIFRWVGIGCLIAILCTGIYAYWGNLYLAGLTQSHTQESQIRTKLATLEGQISAALDAQLQTGGDFARPRLTGCVLYSKATNAAATNRHYSSGALAALLEGSNHISVPDAPDIEFLNIAKGEYNDTCNQWLITKGDIQAQQKRLNDFVNFGWGLVSFSWAPGVTSAAASKPGEKPSGEQNPAVELSGVAAVAIANGYVLPLLMGTLGSLVFVLRTYLVQLQDKTLQPRDKYVYDTRLVLGIILGLAIGFFLQPTAAKTTTPDQFNVVVNLATPALAFLAGYAVEIVFGLLDSFAQVLFQARKQA